MYVDVEKEWSVSMSKMGELYKILKEGGVIRVDDKYFLEVHVKNGYYLMRLIRTLKHDYQTKSFSESKPKKKAESIVIERDGGVDF